MDRASTTAKVLRPLIALFVTANPIERLRLVLNADYGRDSARNSQDLTQFDAHDYFGVMLGARIGIVDKFGIAARGEYFRDNGGFISGHSGVPMALAGGTLTLHY